MDLYLALFLKYKDYQQLRYNLIKFNNLDEAINYTKQFEDKTDIKRLFQDELQEFIMDSRKTSSYHEDKKGKPINYLCLYYKDSDNNLRFLPVLYKNDKESYFSKREYIKKIVTFISDYRKENNGRLIECINLLMDNGIRYHFSNDELYSFNKYLKTGINNYLYELAIKMINNLKKMDSGRLKLLLIKDKNEVKKETINISSKSEIIKDNCNDERFIKLVNANDYDALFREYDFDTIFSYSIDKEKPIGSKRR